MPTTITRDELLRRLGDVALVEALPIDHYAREHLPGATNLPGPLCAEAAAELVPDVTRPIVVYCSGPGCGRSTAAAVAFERLGYTDVAVYRGGKADWFAAGLPMESAASVA